MRSYRNQLIFHPVGQGGFITGQLFDHRSGAFDPEDLKLTYVYDCGSEPHQGTLNRVIDKFANTALTTTIDILTISHFDADHRNGLSRLLNRFHVKLVLLPYAPLDVRLADSMAGGAGGGDTHFARNPTQFIMERAERRVDRIAYVRGSGPDDKGEEGERSPILISLDDEPDLREGARPEVRRLDEYDLSPENPEVYSEAAAEGLTHSAGRTTILPSNCVLLSSIWEFAPYNDQKWKPRHPEAFADAVARLREDLTQARGRSSSALSQLRRLYDEQFGDTSPARNRISLSLYTGPKSHATERNNSALTWRSLPQGPFTQFVNDRGKYGQLLTGDADYKVQAFKRLCRHPSFRERIEHIGVFQAPHHGSRHNWHKGLADKLKPDATVFCADPNYIYGHPDIEVLHDVLTRRTFLANGQQGVVIDTKLNYPDQLRL
ncbi:MAG: hypothetical protein GC208_00875 [Alphaproteobacteria bacterium]|nr:hypothetical protein [Alphaproteobacteria bacterium]